MVGGELVRVCMHGTEGRDEGGGGGGGSKGGLQPNPRGKCGRN